MSGMDVDVSQDVGSPERPKWARVGSFRRTVLLALILLPTLTASWVMNSLLPDQGLGWLNVIMTGLFAILFGWISVGFWSSLAGFWVMVKRGDGLKVLKNLPPLDSLPSDFRTAILFPVYNEDPRMVFAGVDTVRRSLQLSGEADHFDVFVLSDSTDPDVWVAEEEAFGEAAKVEMGGSRLFYRHRLANLKRKSGNIADFCRRWGADYRYMIIFDADSLMSADSLIRLTLAMESRPDIGIIQSPPKAIFSQTLLARIQQFAGHLYGPIFAAGLHYWQLGEAQYWGHNAIIRLEPFVRYCQLPRVPGRSPLSGDILSHDFVESALMRRAGYGVWLAYDLEGSWEQSPSTLVDELIRDRRWCQGNLQHSRLVFARGFFPTHRALFINGIMSYGSALLWLFFLLASSAEALSSILVAPIYFPEGPSLFPDWPRYFPVWALTLLSSTALLLFFPKLLAAVAIIARGRVKAFGGFFPLMGSIILEVLVSTFLAPVRMLFHSLFVVTTFLGFRVTWSAQNRDLAGGLTWLSATKFHWFGVVLGLVWGLSMYIISPGFFLWLSPVVAGLALSIPLSVLTSRVSWGNWAFKLGLLKTPADTQPEPEIQELAKSLQAPDPVLFLDLPPDKGFVRAVVIPQTLELHLSISARKRKHGPRQKARFLELRRQALEKGPDSLSARDKKLLLSDREELTALHWAVWSLEGEKARRWGLVD
ncbi:MAG: glucans biosynthesis glucosyltransferase MdoH [Deltaproteobacteria bacterium]|jgi:membrane glycosyltransferase|nr:glucans biosynthesis glucosyltransferase MdoH [Deltaproteobacteria bacterium]